MRLTGKNPPGEKWPAGWCAFTGEFYVEASNYPATLEDSYGLIDASLNWNSADGLWDITAWGKNLADEDYRVYNILSNVAGTVSALRTLCPMEIGRKLFSIARSTSLTVKPPSGPITMEIDSNLPSISLR